MRLKNVDVGEGSLSPEQITEFIDQMQVYEGAMYEISTKLEILDSEFQVRFSHNPIHHMERRLKSLNSILGKLQRRNLPLTVDAIKDNLFDLAGGNIHVYRRSRTVTVRCMSSTRCRCSCHPDRTTRR